MPPLWMLLLLSCEWVYSAPDIPQSVHLKVEYGDTVTLPCVGTALVGEEDVVSWEVMGNEVVSLTGDQVVIQEKYKDRVRFSSGPQTAAGDWSLVLLSVGPSDSGMYMCIHGGHRALFTVWLTVERPVINTVMEMFSFGDSVTLPCYLELPITQSPENLNVWWEKDGKILLERKNNMLTSRLRGSTGDLWERVKLETESSRDSFPFHLTSDTVISPGEYTCWYLTKDSDDPQPGFPGTITLVVKDSSFTPENPTEGSTEEWGSAFTMTMPLWTEEITEATTTEETVVILDQVTASIEHGETTGPLPLEANKETATSFPQQDREAVGPVDWDDFPWIRTGLIAGVLLATAAVLCVLGALHKL